MNQFFLSQLAKTGFRPRFQQTKLGFGETHLGADLILALFIDIEPGQNLPISRRQLAQDLSNQAHALTEDVRTLTREAKDEIERVGIVTERVNAVADGVGRAVNGLAGLTRAGQLIGVAAGLKKGFDVFVARFAKAQGDHHGG